MEFTGADAVSLLEFALLLTMFKEIFLNANVTVTSKMQLIGGVRLGQGGNAVVRLSSWPQRRPAHIAVRISRALRRIYINHFLCGFFGAAFIV